MGRLDLGVGHLDEASYDASEGLKIEPGNAALHDLEQKVEIARAQRR
jgi:hypothetical protein